MNIIQWSKDEVCVFAANELKRLIEKSGDKPTCSLYTEAACSLKYIHLMPLSKYNKIYNSLKKLTLSKDGYAIISDIDNIWIIGKEPRAILYGVYDFCSKLYGYRWVNPGQEEKDSNLTLSLKKSMFCEPLFTRRGNVIETINDVKYLKALVDWGAKNRLNEFFFTFSLWDQVKQDIKADLRKRGFQVTLGGHSLKYLLDHICLEEDRKQLEQKQLIHVLVQEGQLQKKLIDKIKEYILEESMITRVSIWPQDVGIDEKQEGQFLSTYIYFIERLKEELQQAKAEIKVEHIAYNAGLSWNLLERNNVSPSDSVDVLFAYWGRDYSLNISSEQNHRYQAAMEDWVESIDRKKRTMTVFEYYSDQFMLSELFPPLTKRIFQDIAYYHQLGVSGILNLIVPPIHKHQVINPNQYHWKWIHQINNYIYSQSLWGDTYEKVMQIFTSQFSNPAEVQQLLIDLEKQIAPQTKWNTLLFPARIIDSQDVEEKEGSTEIIQLLSGIISYLDDCSVSTSEGNRSDELLLFYLETLKKIASQCKADWE